MKRFAASLAAAMASVGLGMPCSALDEPKGRPQAPASTSQELPVREVPGVAEGGEAYFSPDGKALIFQGKFPGDSAFHVYTINIDGSNLRKINDRGADACSFFRPDGKALVWTSTRDNLDLPPGNFSDPKNYPQGAELYLSDLDGRNVTRLTHNRDYDAEVTYAPDGHKILFGRQIGGKMDLWTMNPDGSDQRQITFSPDLQEGGAVYLPDSKTIITRAWKKSEEHLPSRDMQVYTLNEDGSDWKQITSGPGTHWAPYPAPDGIHAAYVKLLPPRNFEIVLLNLRTGEERQLTSNPAFDGFPAISPDGKLLSFSSGRDAKPGTRKIRLYLMDISSLGIGPK
ncbi:TolB family protein [Aquisphaera insulae]|uniref:TolB family protein n=1 Tax=Aquisphaera insulae TaxID=2712864 RepID=UPI0013ED5115|nr:PD40 domain-containing protein [Aquisphaera insulae]